MVACENYGVVYTPQGLAGFVAELLVAHLHKDGCVKVLDPACGEGVLLKELAERLRSTRQIEAKCYGVDIDEAVIARDRREFDEAQYCFLRQNFILPSTSLTAYGYWRHRLRDIDCIVANPPWSSEKIFDRAALDRAGYVLDVGQYDSYVLFLELCVRLAREGALLAFLVPDSLFSGENRSLRKFLLENTQIEVLARLGEKLFTDVNRAVSVLLLRKGRPTAAAMTRCYRLDTADRRAFLEGRLDLYRNFREKSHLAMQARFLQNPGYVFDIDAREEDEALLKKLEEGRADPRRLFRFGRGVEISKSGTVVMCAGCGMAQVYTRSSLSAGSTVCRFCGERIPADARTLAIISREQGEGTERIYVGESIHRYSLDSVRYLKTGIRGVNYKDRALYLPPKLLIRKTGLGIYAAVDRAGTYTSQTVYSLFAAEPLEYYLGVLNSRVIYYYYLKKYGENEWKSHPYLTKDILFSLPIKDAETQEAETVRRIAALALSMSEKYDRATDMRLEALVMQLYGVTPAEAELIAKTLNALPDLSAVNQMKFTVGELECSDT